MAQWDWLLRPHRPYDRRFVRNVVVKAALLFIAINSIYALVQPLPSLSGLTLYNGIMPGRERLPYADDPSSAYNMALASLDALIASHIISGQPKVDNEFRVLLLGDSSVWGWLLTNEQTLSACLNAGDFHTADGRQLHAYNLGYPVLSTLKDDLILQEVLDYQPDAVVWLTTLQALYRDEQLRHPILQNNPDRARALVEQFNLAVDTSVLPDQPNFWQRTLVGQRRDLADLLRNQLYGLAWMATGFDHTDPDFYQRPEENFPPSEGIPTRPYIEVGNLSLEYLSFDVLQAGIQLAAENNVPTLVVNQPIFIGRGINSELRYNDLYPRWAYDAYRQMLGELVAQNDWNYADLWDFVPVDSFTDSPLHYTAEATCDVAVALVPQILAMGD